MIYLFLAFLSYCLTLAASAWIVGYIEARPDGIVQKLWDTGRCGNIIFILIFILLLIF